MTKKVSKKIVIEGQEAKIKSMEFTLDLNVRKEDFDKLLKAMSNISPSKENEEEKHNP